MSSDGGSVPARQPLVGLNPHEDARSIVRLFQCQQCSYPIKEPITLPCGYSLCRRCLPPSFRRENITYPPDPLRIDGILCPFPDCGLQHALSDCGPDVTLNKIMQLVQSYADTYHAGVSDCSLLLKEQLHWPNMVASSIDIMPRSRVLPGGRVLATYIFAAMGELNYHSDVTYTPAASEHTGTIEALDVTFVNNIREVVRAEVECQVCYSLMLDPLTTSCGHTFCRKCVARVLDHSNLCPVCRRRLPVLPGAQAEPSNKVISNIISGLLAELMAARLALTEQDDVTDEDERVPLFPCTLAYPHMPTFLHIFEPRYRLMIRRVIENGSRRFGILAYNALGRPQGTLGNVQFMQYGTMLAISRVERFPDGRSLIESAGVYRFRVIDHSMFDGYMVGRIQRIDDMSLADEEAHEARETSGPEPGPDDIQGRFDRMPTEELVQYGLDFIAAARSRSAHWLHERVLAAYGQPPTDPAVFPYWFASVLPISEEEKYRLLPTTSVRERLKMTARWIHRLEASQCVHDRTLARTVLDFSSDEEEEEEEEEDDDDDDDVEEEVEQGEADGNDDNDVEHQPDGEESIAPAEASHQTNNNAEVNN